MRSSPRGWQLGGGATYSALVLARLGLCTGVVLGVDREAAVAPELDLLRQAGVEVVLARLRHGPIFENIERPSGRIQECLDPGEPIPPGALPREWRSTRAWVLAPVADELPDAWGAIPPGPLVAVGWQGLLRELTTRSTVRVRPPSHSSLVWRADLVGASATDFPPMLGLEELLAYLRPGSDLVMTFGRHGGLVMRAGAPKSAWRPWHYRAVPAERQVDPTGAGDCFLAALLAARLASGRSGSSLVRGADVAVAAAVASLVVEGPGLASVPWPGAVRDRVAELRGRAGAG